MQPCDWLVAGGSPITTTHSVVNYWAAIVRNGGTVMSRAVNVSANELIPGSNFVLYSAQSKEHF